MGGGEHYPAPRHVAFPTSQPPSEEVDGQIPRHHQPWLTQQPESSILPSELAWTDMGIPVQPSLQQALNNCSPPLSHLAGEEQHLRDDPNAGHAIQRNPLVLRPRQNSDQSSRDIPDIKEELLTAPHDNQGTLERCTCDTQPVNSEKEDKKPRKPRKRLEESERQQTSRTRECTPNDNDPAGPCEGCLRVALNQSKKVRYHIGCHRYKLQEVVLFRTSGSKVTDRWHGAQVRNVVTQGRVRSVQMCQEGIDAPFIFEVRKLPKASRDSYNDQDKRVWFTGIGLDREEIAGFGLANVHETILRYKAYIHISVLGNENCQPAIQPAIQKVANEFRELNYDVAVVGEVFQKAWYYFCSLPDDDQGHDFYPPMGKKLPIISEKQFLFGFFELWFALRHSMGWSWIKEKLPGTEVIERFPPLKGEFATPRVVVGQIDCIRISCVLKPLTKSLLKVLMKWIAERNYDCWMSIFFATFILLSELAKATEDAYHHGWYDKDIKGEGPKHVHIIRDIHESANIILAHWHYYNYSTNPLEFSLNDQGARNKTPLRALTADQLAAVQKLWEEIHQWRQRQNENELYDNKNEQWWRKWCHPLYFAESMFDSSWKPREVFSG
ncbi:hypothetical protein J7T55_004995 [Diaporthe amygdali]|uniref:uncharacterized protein n=1 Tax=Phomopsis amygdali TaxID=1214568 RepID=UPI0022FE315C|nr:uncharacterized protein J7T55_004995 [Diaporthe amygdali]KAJ0116050.1 hypothetical protein J7T55_004995 [Diaporthe amygdali]